MLTVTVLLRSTFAAIAGSKESQCLTILKKIVEFLEIIHGKEANDRVTSASHTGSQNSNTNLSYTYFA